MNIRDTENITILRTIVHVIDKIQYQKAIISDNEIDLTTMDVEVHKFISDHIKKSVNNNESKLAKFSSPRTMVQALSNSILENPDVFFVHHSQRIAQHLYNNSPNNSTPGCLVIVLYSDTTEDFLALIKLDKNDSILYEKNSNGDYELVRRGSTLPAPSKRTKLLKFATLRNTNEISEDELDTRPSLIILDSQAEEFTRFFFKTFLDSEFLLTDEHKSEKLMEGLSDFLRSSVDYSLDQKSTIMDSFADKLRNNEYFNVEEAGQQILSPI